MTRQCGQCTLCCKLVPVAEMDKVAGQRCRHQRLSKGCAIYAKRPLVCRMWNCRWLTDDDTADLSRPDHSHVVIDSTPDYVTAVGEDGRRQTVPVLQLWCDPRHPEAWRAPAILAYIERRGKEGFGAIIRFDSNRATCVFPPSLTGTGWVENDAGIVDKEHTMADIAAALGPDFAVVFDADKALAGMLK